MTKIRSGKMASSRVMLTGTCLVHAVISENGRKRYRRESELEKATESIRTETESTELLNLSHLYRLFRDLSHIY